LLSILDNNVVDDKSVPYAVGMTARPGPGAGADLALLLLGGYRRLIDAVVVELAERGHADVRASHHYAMRAIDAGADNASELARRLAVTKQAAARIIETLLDRGYVARERDPGDARRKRIQVTPLGTEVMAEGAAVLDDLRRQWARTIGKAELARVERALKVMVGDAPVRLDAPGWVAHD
jgi:DNA-binding MarR family transcriptional regulator